MAADSREYSFQPDYAISPGETLREIMTARSMTPEALAARLGLTRKSLRLIFTGKKPIRPEMSAKLELVFGVPARFWDSFQAQYEKLLAGQKANHDR